MAEEYKDPQADLKNAFNKVGQAAQDAAAVLKEEPVEVEEEVEKKETVKEEEVAEVTNPDEAEEPIIESEPKEDDTPEEQETPNEVVAEEDNVISDWDITSEEADAPADFDFKSLASEVGFEAESKDDFVNKVNEIKAKADAPDPMANVPDNLREAIKIANQDGNYLEYLGVTSVDYDAVPDLDVVQSHYSQMFAKPDGSVDQDMLEMKMDGMTDADIQVEGRTLKAQYKSQQDSRKAQIEADTTRNREQADKSLRVALDLVKEQNGFKYSPSNKKQLYDGITSGNMISEMFHGDDGKMDYNKVIKAYSNHKFGDKQIQYLKQQISTKATKKVLDKLSNKQIEPKVGLPDATPKKEKTGQQKVAEELKERGADLFKQ